MSQLINVKHYGMVRGKYTYYVEDMSFYRRITNKPSGNIIKIELSQQGGSFGWNIYGDWINRNKMKDHCSDVYLDIIAPF